MVIYLDTARTGQLLYEVDALWIVFRKDCSLVGERARSQLRRVREKLKAGGVERNGVFFSAYIFDGQRLFFSAVVLRRQFARERVWAGEKLNDSALAVWWR